MKIRVTRTEIFEYEPNLEEEFYVEHECSTIEQALEADKKFYENCKGDLDEITTAIPEISTSWQIVDD